MWNNCSYNTGAFPKLDNMKKNDIEGSSGTQLAKSLAVFSTWMLSESKPGLDCQKNSRWIPEVMSKTIGNICVVL